MEILEMFCDLILARFGLVTQLKELDEGISEAVSSIIWVAPRLQADVAELKVVSEMLTAKYGKPYADASRAAVHPANVSDKLQHKMSIQAPPKLLVEKYLIEIAKIYNIDYEPDQSIMQSDPSQINRPDGFLIDFNNDRNNLDGNIPAPPGPGFAAYPQPPPLPVMPQPPANIPFNYPPQAPFNYPGPGNNSYHGPGNNSFSGPGNNSFSGPGNNSFSGPGNNSYPEPGNNSYPGPSNNSNNGGGGMSGYPNLVPSAPFNYNYNIPPNSSTEKKDLNVNFLGVSKNFLFL
jgi:Regulator of Vps4 activity in the MVB pathway